MIHIYNTIEQISLQGGTVVKMRINNILLAVAMMMLVNPLSVYAIDYYVEIVPPSPSSVQEGPAIPSAPVSVLDICCESR